MRLFRALPPPACCRRHDVAEMPMPLLMSAIRDAAARR